MSKVSLLNLSPIDVSSLDVAHISCDLHRDLHVFIEYVRTHEIKRATRTNQIGKTDARRLAKLLSDDEALAQIEEEDYSSWIDTVDALARNLGFIEYDTEGSYAGYSSSAPSFPDNYIQLIPARYSEFAQMSLARQERLIFDTLISTYPSNEFFHHALLGRLSGFSIRGSALGVMPMLDFQAIRRFMFAQLATVQSGIWYSVADLVHHLKRQEPYFLIPRQPRFKNEHERKMGRYGNFRESTQTWGDEIQINDEDPDAFERVEGRYVERFLEAIPLLAGYVDVAYAAKEYKGVYPPRDYLRAFRLHDHFVRFMQGELSEPSVTVLPNYEIHVTSPIYPTRVLTQLAPLTELVRSDRTTVLKLDKRKTTAALAQDASLDVAKLLTDLTGRALPQNLAREIAEWAGHSENFVLYDGFGLFESSKETLSLADPFTVERISPTLRIVHSPAILFTQLEQAAEIPLRVTHTEKALRRLPPEATTLFRTQSKPTAPAKPKKQPLTLRRKALVTLHFPNQVDLDALHKALVSARCPVEVDRTHLTLTYASQHEAQVNAVFKQLADRYLIKIEEIETRA